MRLGSDDPHPAIGGQARADRYRHYLVGRRAGAAINPRGAPQVREDLGVQRTAALRARLRRELIEETHWKRVGPLACLHAGYEDVLRPIGDDGRRHWTPDPRAWLLSPLVGTALAAAYLIFGIPETSARKWGAGRRVGGVLLRPRKCHCGRMQRSRRRCCQRAAPRSFPKSLGRRGTSRSESLAARAVLYPASS
jgi:hypothetical protein